MMTILVRGALILVLYAAAALFAASQSNKDLGLGTAQNLAPESSDKPLIQSKK